MLPMFRLKDPQRSLFGSSMLLPEEKRTRLEDDWPGEFRRSALPLIDEERFRGLYCADNGRPNKAVMTVIGALILKEIEDLTDAEAVGAVDFDLRWHVALDLEPEKAHICQKTLHNFRAKLMASDEGRRLFEEMTERILKALGVSADRQRLDSTHIMSNMAVLTRLGLFCETLRVFLRELKKLLPEKYEAIPAGLRGRYLKDDARPNRYEGARSSEGRRRLRVCARDLWRVLDRFRGDEDVEGLESRALLQRLFTEQCEQTAEPVSAAEGDADAEDSPVAAQPRLPKEVDSASLQSPHDEDATYGHKGKGYEVQVGETCGNKELPEIITDVDVTRSCDSDDAATLPMVDNLAERDLEPKEMIADTTYGSTENVLACRERGVELVAPVAGPEVEASKEDELTEGDFEIDPEGKQKTRCPRGCRAESETRNVKRGKVVAVFSAPSCRDCPHADSCPARRRKNGNRVLRTTLKKAELARRRKYQNTAEFRERYAIRAGIEATNSELKRGHGLGHLRVRGFLRVRLAVHMKALACNVKRMLKHLVAKRKAAAKAALLPQNASERPWNVFMPGFRPSARQLPRISAFAPAA